MPQSPSAPDYKRWVIPAAIGACVALLLALGGIAIGMLVGGSSDSPSNSVTAGPTLTHLPVPNRPADSPSEPSNAPPRPQALPPTVPGPDATGQSCAGGLSYPGASGRYSHSSRGTIETSCLSAQNVLTAFWQSGPPSSAPRTVYALGAVPCGSTGGRCSGSHFIMECSTYGADDWVTCTGGKNARVYIY